MNFGLTGWVCQSKPFFFWIPAGDSFQKAYLEEWIYIVSDPSANGNTVEDCTTKRKRSEEASSTSRPAGQPDWDRFGSQTMASSWEKVEAPMPPPQPRCKIIHPKQLGPYPVRLELPFPKEEIQSGYEDDVSSGTDAFTAWRKIDQEVILAHHMVDIQKAAAQFREAAGSSKSVPRRLPTQRRLSIYNWNPRPRRGKEGAIENQIARRWHIITLQESSEYVDHDLVANQFHITHYGGCAILFSKNTFYSDIDVKSIYLHDTRRVLPDRVEEGCQGWVMQGVLSRATFRRLPLNSKGLHNVMSTHQQCFCQETWNC